MKYIFLSVFLITAALLAAQPGGTPIGGVNPTPVDGGVTLLLAAGAAYGVKKYRDRKA